VVENLVVAEHGELMVVQACAVQNLPLMVGGRDFNIIRTKKNNIRYNERWSFLFNAMINNLYLRELELSRG
jgi:hypothetical protein